MALDVPGKLRCSLVEGLRRTSASYDRKRGVRLLSELNSRTAQNAGAGNNWRKQAKNSDAIEESESQEGLCPEVRNWVKIMLTLGGGGLGHYEE